MTRVLAWLRRDLAGSPRWRWLLCLLLAGAATLAIGHWAAAAWGLLALVRVPGRVPAGELPPDPAPGALAGHRAAEATDRALARVAAEARSAGEAARQAAATDPLDEVAARVERRARERKT